VDDRAAGQVHEFVHEMHWERKRAVVVGHVHHLVAVAGASVAVASCLNPTTEGFAMTVDGAEGHAEGRLGPDEREGVARLTTRRQVSTERVKMEAVLLSQLLSIFHHLGD